MRLSTEAQQLALALRLIDALDHFPGKVYQVDAETLRSLYQLAARCDDGSVMSSAERSILAGRMKALSRQSEKVE